MFATSIHIWLPIEIFFLEMEEEDDGIPMVLR
jgi:hypothetical protein